MRLEAWFEEFNEGPIMSISFDKLEGDEDDISTIHGSYTDRDTLTSK